jgi:NADPH2:quinone reductase
MELPKPFIPGCDLAGVVESVGPGVTRYIPGDRVWGSNQGLLGRQGTAAELICVHEEWLYPIPDGVSDESAAAGALTGITAHLGLYQKANLQPGETVFVNGGTGGVGSMVVQLARAHDAQVFTTVGSEEKVILVRQWGGTPINYKTEDVAARIHELTDGKGVDVWYETQREPQFLKIVERMAPRGRIIIIAGRTAHPIFPVGPFYVKGLSLFGFAMFNATQAEQRACAEDINQGLAAGKIQPPVGKVFSLAQAAEAHRFLEENTLGKAGTLVGKVLLQT